MAVGKAKSLGCVWIVLGVLVVAVLGFGGCAVSGYNKAVRYSEGTDAAWAQVENQLKRRYDLIPNLVETVKGYAKHEEQLFTHIADTRTKYFQAGTRPEKVEAASRMEGLLSRLLVLREQYPNLKANESFLKLQDELAGAENRIAVERKRYNDAVRTLNTYRRSFFGRMFCSWADVESAEYFETPEAEKAVPKVKF